MQYTRSFPFLLLALVIGHVCAQQFADAPVALNYPTFSNSCLEALNTTVADCSSILLHIWDTKPRLELDELSVLCTPDCRTALMKVRETIAAGCTSSTDVFEVDAVVWPGM